MRSRHLAFATKSAFFLLLLGFGLIAFLAGGVDFRGYYAAATLVRRGGNPYDYAQLAPVLEEITGFVGNNPYYYPPWFCLLFVPLTFLPFQAARAVWLLVNLILFFISLEQLRQALDWEPAEWQRWGAYSVSTLMFAAYCLRSEQAGILLLLGLSVALNAIKQGRPVMAGLGLTIALTKPQVTALTILVLGLWLLAKRPRSVAWAIGWIATLTALASLVIPNWWAVSREGFGQGLWYQLEGPRQIDSVRVNSTVYDFSTYVLHVDGPAQYLIVFLVGAVGLGVMFFAWHRLQDVVVLTSASTLTTLLLTPYALQYDYVPLTIPLFWMFSQIGSLRAVTRLVVAVLLSLSFSVLVWQDWSYEGYWQLLGVFAAFSVVLASVGRKACRKGGCD
ncbi:MAG: glycosyltransferase family 87 protein [Anaerolineae bacterium]